MAQHFRYLFLLFVCLCSAYASQPVSVKFLTPHTFDKPTEPGKEIPVAIVIDLEPGWHTYAPDGEHAQQSPKIEIQLPSGVSLSSWVWPAAKRIKNELDPNETFLGYDNQLVLTATLTATDPIFLKDLPKASISFVMCEKVCQFFEARIPLTKAKYSFFTNLVAPKEVNNSDESIGWGWIVLYALLGGLILNLMPCVLPVLSLKILGLIQHNTPNQMRTSGVAFTLGTFLTFWTISTLLVILKAQGTAIGWGFQLQSPTFVFLLMVLFVALALNLFGVYEIGVSLTGLSQEKEKGAVFSSSFFSGVLAVIVASPCSAPFMGVALGYALTQSPVTIFVVMSALALGFCLPFLFLCLVPHWAKYIPQPGRWMVSLRQLMGFAMFASVLWFLNIFVNQTNDDQFIMVAISLLFISFSLWIYGRWGGYGHKSRTILAARTAAALFFMAAILLPILSLSERDESPKVNHVLRTIAWEPYSAEQVQSYQKAGKTVFIDFTASWCITCQWNKKMILNKKEVIDLFERQGIVPMRADWTNRDNNITQALQNYGRNSIPTYVILKPDQKAIVLPEILSISKLKKFMS